MLVMTKFTWLSWLCWSCVSYGLVLMDMWSFACMCSYLCIKAFKNDTEWLEQNIPLRIIWKVVCAYVSILSTSGCTIPYFFPFSKTMYVQDVQVSRSTGRRLGNLSQVDWWVLNVRAWSHLSSIVRFSKYLRHSFFPMLKRLLYALCGNYWSVWGLGPNVVLHFRWLNVRRYN